LDSSYTGSKSQERKKLQEKGNCRKKAIVGKRQLQEKVIARKGNCRKKAIARKNYSILFR